MGSVGTRTNLSGLGDDYVITAYPYPDNIATIRRDFFNKLKDAGFFGTEEEIEEALRNHRAWQNMENARRRKEEWKEEGIREVTPEEYNNASWKDSLDMYMSFENFKKMVMGNAGGTWPKPTNSMAEYLNTFFGGASIHGYGRGNHPRQRWDERSGFSNWLDNNKQLWLNTDKTLYRGIRLSQGSINDLQKAMKSGDLIDFRGPSSWTSKWGTAVDFANYSLVGKRNQNLTIFEDVTKGARNAMPFPYGSDSEIIYSGTSKFKVVGIRKDEEGVYYVKVTRAE